MLAGVIGPLLHAERIAFGLLLCLGSTFAIDLFEHRLPRDRSEAQDLSRCDRGCASAGLVLSVGDAATLQLQLPMSRSSADPLRKPSWLKIRAPIGRGYAATKLRLRRLRLSTVCTEARCPNLADCWDRGTAALMLLGETCTRGCSFCAVRSARHGDPLDPSEPERVAATVVEMGLQSIVLTSVDRDDLHDGGAAHFAATIRAIRSKAFPLLIEALIPDFGGCRESLALLLAAAPDVVAHNVEVVRRLTPSVRDPRCDYDLSLSVLRRIKKQAPAVTTKSSIMLGLGERDSEVRETLNDLKGAGVDIVTIGQYLQPSSRHLRVVEYSPVERFRDLGEEARALGFTAVASAPLVRSSFRTGELQTYRLERK